MREVGDGNFCVDRGFREIQVFVSNIISDTILHLSALANATKVPLIVSFLVVI